MRHHRRQPAFTLLELILVLVIVGLLMAVVAPRLIGLRDRTRLDGQARTLHAMLAEARLRATQDGVPWRVVIDRDEHEAWLESRTSTGDNRPRDTTGQVIELDEKLDVEWLGQTPREDALLAIGFEPGGITEPGQLRLWDDEGSSVAITCASYTEPYRIGPAPASSTAAQQGAYTDAE